MELNREHLMYLVLVGFLNWPVIPLFHLIHNHVHFIRDMRYLCVRCFEYKEQYIPCTRQNVTTCTHRTAHFSSYFDGRFIFHGAMMVLIKLLLRSGCHNSTSFSRTYKLELVTKFFLLTSSDFLVWSPLLLVSNSGVYESGQFGKMCWKKNISSDTCHPSPP